MHFKKPSSILLFKGPGEKVGRILNDLIVYVQMHSTRPSFVLLDEVLFEVNSKRFQRKLLDFFYGGS